MFCVRVAKKRTYGRNLSKSIKADVFRCEPRRYGVCPLRVANKGVKGATLEGSRDVLLTRYRKRSSTPKAYEALLFDTLSIRR